MRTIHGRRRRPTVMLAVVMALVLLIGGATPAFAALDFTSPWPVLPGESGVEPGWPADHQISDDPRPGDASYIAPFETEVVPPDGMTDEEFAAVAPEEYAATLPRRTAVESELLESVHELLAAEGVAPTKDATMSETDAATAAAAVAASPYSPYGYLTFTLQPNSTSPYARNGYLGTLRFIYGIYNARVDAYKWYTVSWPARSGNNKPASQRTAGVGPIPEYTWDFGFAGGTWRGYEPDGRVSFSPGKWRLDPWTGGPYGRCYLEVHGGIGSSQFAATSGCIRLYPSGISSLKTYYDTKMANKKNRSSAHLYVDY